MHACMEAIGGHSLCCSIIVCFTPARKGLSLNLEFASFSDIVSQQAPAKPPVSLPTLSSGILKPQSPTFYGDGGDLNSSPYTLGYLSFSLFLCPSWFLFLKEAQI